MARPEYLLLLRFHLGQRLLDVFQRDEKTVDTGPIATGSGQGQGTCGTHQSGNVGSTEIVR